jgi:hypothetical protein
MMAGACRWGRDAFLWEAERDGRGEDKKMGVRVRACVCACMYVCMYVCMSAVLTLQR